ncbi:WYL domain-containing protein [Sphingomonas sp. RS2018]
MSATQTTEKTAAPALALPTLFEAIVKQLCVKATYNRDWVVLAPHVLYTRHGEVYVDAITVARNGMLPREDKLGTFKVSGLGDPTLTGRAFVPNAIFEPDAEKYDGVALLKVEPAAVD